MNTVIKGAKAGEESARKAVIAADSAQSKTNIKILYGLSEGEVEGLANGLQSVYLEETPLQNPAGGNNFEGVVFDFRYGTNDQAHIEGFPDIVSESAVSVELKSETPWVRAISNTDLDAVNIRFKWGPLRSQNADNGDVNGVLIEYKIDLQTDGGSWVEVLRAAMNDKTSANYERSHRIDLPSANTGWTIRARRITPNSTSEYVSDKMYVEAITEVIDLKLSYPNTALLGLQYDAETFSNVAKVAVDLKGIKLQVPSNYNPVARTYTGMWDGTFKRAYTSNPAWIYYDLCTSKRYALGDRLTSLMLDKWSLYRLAQYCDQMVSDGKGGQEPRFTCNVYLQSTEDAYVILSKLAGVFRAISYWDGNSIVCDADIPQDTYFTYTRANVIDGMFEYSGTRARDRHTVAKVAWDNPVNHYKTEYVYVRDEAAIAKLGVRIADIDAWGCTSEGQAQRAGLWALKSEQLETRTVSFKVGLDGYIPQPGKVIEIADELFAGRANGGRISAVSANRKIITLDRDDVVCRVGDRLVVNGEDGRAQARIVSSKIGRNVTVTIAFDSVAAENVWVVDAQDLKTMKFRVMSVTQDEKHQFSITGLQYESAKYNAIDFGAFIDERPISIINPTIQAPVDSVAITTENMVQQGLTVATMVISWAQVSGATKYQVEWRKDDGSWIKLPITGNNSVEVQGVYSGNYEARVIAINAFDAASLPTYSVLTALSGKQGLPPKLAFIQATGKLFGFELNWGFPATGALDTAYTEIRIASTANGANAAQLGLFAYPTTTHTINGAQPNLTQWFSGRLIDRIGNIGEWSAWTSAITSADASAILDILGGKISASELNQALQTKINKIDSIAGLDGDIGNLVEDFSALQTTVSSINNGLAQEAIDRLAAIKLLDDGFTQEKLDRQTGDAQITGLITNYKQSNDTSLANVRQKAEAAVSASSANSELITTLDSRTLIAEGNATTAKANAATALDKATTATTQSAATAEKVEQVRAIANQAADGTDLANQTSATALQKATASAQTSSANAEKIVSLEVNLGTKASTGALAQTNATVADINDRVLAGTTKLDGVYAQVNAKMIGSSDELIGSDGGYAATWTLQSAIIEGDTQQAERIDTTLVKVADNLAAIQNEAQVRLTADSAISYRVDTVQANFENNRAIVQQQIIAISNEQGSSVQKFEQLEAKAESAQDSADSASIQAAAAEAAAKSYAKSQADAAREAAALDATAKADAAEQRAKLVADAAQWSADKAHVAAAEAAEDARNKGEVIFGAAPPSAAKRLPQNLWIDTTGSANTPKRWNGSAWVVVTDKAATDAAAVATAAKLEAEEATRNIATIKIEQGGFANKLDAASGEIKTIQTRLSGQTDSIEVVNAVGNLEALKISLAKDRLDKDVTKLQGKTTALNALIASIDEKISGLNVKKQKPDITPEETSLLNSQISELNGAKTDANTQKNDIAAQVLQINNEKSQLNSLVVTESKIKAQSTIKIDAGGKIYGYGLAVEESGGTNYSDFIIRSDSFALAAPYVQGQAEKATSFPFVYRLTPFTDPITGTVFPIGAYMKSASMDYQSVKTSHIEDLAVKSAQIDNLAVTSGKIGALQVDSLHIKNRAVTVPLGIKQVLTNANGTATAYSNWQKVVRVRVYGLELIESGNYCTLFYAIDLRMETTVGKVIYVDVMVGDVNLARISGSSQNHYTDTGYWQPSGAEGGGPDTWIPSGNLVLTGTSSSVSTIGTKMTSFIMPAGITADNNYVDFKFNVLTTAGVSITTTGTSAEILFMEFKK